MPTAGARAVPDRAVGACAALAAVALVVLLVTPRASPAVLVMLALCVAIAGGRAAGFAVLVRPPLALTLVIGLGVWALLSTTWAFDRGEALSKSLLLIALALAAGWTVHAVRFVAPQLLRRLTIAALLAWLLALLYLLTEELTTHAIKRTFFTLFPVFQPPARHIVRDAIDNDLMLSPYLTNRNMAAATLALWPALLIARTAVDRSWRLPLMSVMLVASAVMVALSSHETSIIALVVACVVLAVTMAVPRLGLGVLAAGWLAATLLVVPMATWALTSAKLETATWLPNSARHRIVLWGYTAQQVANRPLIGIGAASTKRLDVARGPSYSLYPGTHYEWRSGTHAHNIYLQIWYELGAVGAALLCAAGLALIASLARLPRASMPFAAASFAAAASMGASSWGLWQAWFLAAFAASAALSAIAVALDGVQDRELPSAA
jgi:O-antigen ligase